MHFFGKTFSVTRCQVESGQETDIDFSARPFVPIDLESECQQSVGIEQVGPDIDFKIGGSIFLFRVRIQKRIPDPLEVECLLEEKKREAAAKQIECRYWESDCRRIVLQRTGPKTSLVDCIISREWLYIYSSSASEVDEVLTLLHGIGVSARQYAPWMVEGLQSPDSALLKTGPAHESVHGCNFLRYIMGHPDEIVVLQSETGAISALTWDTGEKLTANFTGTIVAHLNKIYEDHSALPTKARLSIRGSVATFRAKDYVLSGVKVHFDGVTSDFDKIEAKLNQTINLFDALDAIFADYLTVFTGSKVTKNPCGFVLLRKKDQINLPLEDETEELVTKVHEQLDGMGITKVKVEVA